MPVKEDRRVGRTRALLQEALLDLMVEKGYEAVTVQDIIDRANVGRSTFYAHYEDKRRLLLSRLRELEAFLSQQQRLVAAGSEDPAQRVFGYSLAMFEHAAEHARIWKAIVGREGGSIVLKELHRILLGVVSGEIGAVLPRGARPSVPANVVGEYAVSSLLGLLTWWLDEGMPCSAAEMDQMFRALAGPGMTAALTPAQRLQPGP
jgi:AcrR family transcriptional regulator